MLADPGLKQVQVLDHMSRAAAAAAAAAAELVSRTPHRLQAFMNSAVGQKLGLQLTLALGQQQTGVAVVGNIDIITSSAECMMLADVSPLTVIDRVAVLQACAGHSPTYAAATHSSFIYLEPWDARCPLQETVQAQHS